MSYQDPVVKYSIWGSVAVVLYFLLFFFTDKALFLHPAVQWASLLVYVACMFQTAKEEAALKGTDREFRVMSRSPFIVFLLINLAYWLFYYGLHLADPELVMMENEAQLALLREQLKQGLGDPEQAALVREQINYLEKSDGTVAVGPIFMRMAIGALGGFAIAALITLYFRSGNRSAVQ